MKEISIVRSTLENVYSWMEIYRVVPDNDS